MDRMAWDCNLEGARVRRELGRSSTRVRQEIDASAESDDRETRREGLRRERNMGVKRIIGERRNRVQE